MPGSYHTKHRIFKWLQKKKDEEPGNGEGAHQGSTPNATPKTTDEPTKTAVTEDLWVKARELLAQDKKMCLVLDEANRILEQSGVKTGTQGKTDHEKLHSSLTSKVEELKLKEMVIHIDDHYINVKEKLIKAIRNVLVLKDLVTTAASASPPVAIVCASMTVALLMFIRADDQDKALLDGLEKTSGLIPRLRMMEDLYLHSSISLASDFMERFKEGLVSLYSKVLEFQARALCFLQKNTFKRMILNMFQEDWDALKANIASQETEARTFTQLIEAQGRKQDIELLTRTIQQADEKHQLQKSTLDRNEKVSRFLKRLYHVCPYNERKARVDERVDGTCNWFTKHPDFQKWKQDKDIKLLFVSAGPGCGKSVLSKYLVEKVLPTGEQTICYFFFRDDYPDQRRHTIALASMLHQLFLPHPYLISDAVLDRHDSEGEKLFESFHTLWDIFVTSITCLKDEHIMCVIDALDECQEDERRQLVRAINEFYIRSNMDHRLKFLLTSRPYSGILEDFRELEAQMPTIHLSGDGEIESEEISCEINLVIKKRVHDIRIRKDLDDREEKFLEEKLTAMPNRTYLWVSLTMDYICNLEGFTKGKVRETVLPETVDGAYEKILRRSKDQHKAKRLLHIILAAERPLSVEELSVAMALKSEDQRVDDILESIEAPERFKTTLRSICGLMLVVVNDKIYLLHQTVKEFLLQESSTPVISLPSCHWRHEFSARESQKILAEICAWHIYAASVEPSLSMHLTYSATYWLGHFRKARFHQQDRITKLACRLSAPGSRLYDTWTAADRSGGEHLRLQPAPIILAAMHGLSSVVQEFLERPDVDIESQDSRYGQTPLSWAAESGHDTVVSLLLSAKADIESQDSSGRTPLSQAARNGHDTVVSLLLSAKADIESKDSRYGQTPLSWAAERGHDTVVSLLLSAKADIESQDSSGRTTLSWAAERGHGTVVSLLLSAKADIESQDSSGRTPLSQAAGNGHGTVVSLLLSIKADIESKDSSGRTPLSWAAGNGHDTVVSLLLSAKADIESQDSEYGQTPLSWAAENGHGTVVSLLLSAKADIESQDSSGHTPLSWAAISGYNTVVSLLLSAKADIESQDSSGRTPLSWAAGNGHDTVVILLLSAKADIESKDSEYGQTPLLWASENGHGTVVSLLLSKKADIESKDSRYGRTPLSWAAEKGHDTVVSLLLSAKVDIESKDSSGRTPLSWAAENGHGTVVSLLLSTKADIESKDSRYGRTPLSWAAEKAHDTVVSLLSSADRMQAE
ncbi:hypothetical protein N7540_012672 [Penicillium herquei]|nr:hypothetical protein N7540_012672 [Penicillium herquei]